MLGQQLCKKFFKKSLPCGPQTKCFKTISSFFTRLRLGKELHDMLCLLADIQRAQMSEMSYFEIAVVKTKG